MTWPSDDEIQNASVVAPSEVEQLLSAVGVDANTMLAKYTEPTVGKSIQMLKVPAPPRSLYEIMQLYTNMLMNIQTKDNVELAITPEDINKTIAM